jgi:hypothetical protein
MKTDFFRHYDQNRLFQALRRSLPLRRLIPRSLSASECEWRHSSALGFLCSRLMEIEDKRRRQKGLARPAFYFISKSRRIREHFVKENNTRATPKKAIQYR